MATRGSLTVCLLALFGSHCQMAPAISGAAKGWKLGNGLKYDLTTILLFRETGPAKPGGDVGFQLTGHLELTPVWKDRYDTDIVLLQFKLVKPKLWIKSRKAPEPEGFVEHTSKLDDTASKPFYATWKNGEFSDIYLDPTDTTSLLNLKKGIISIFQYKTLDGDFQEKDSSGICNVTYTSTGPNVINKKKSFCKHDDLPETIQHPNPIFGVDVTSVRDTTYELSDNLLPLTIIDYEKHDMFLVARPEAGTVVISERTLKQLKTFEDSTRIDILSLATNFKKQTLTLKPELPICPDSGCPTLDKVLNENREALEDSSLGTIKSATAFLRLISFIRRASSEELAKLLKNVKHLPVRHQLYDMLGAVSTPAAHQAAMKMLRQDNTGDATERYLWALSLSPSPNPDIAKDILHRSEETMQNDKVSETMALTAAAMAKQYGCATLIEKARVSLEIGLDSCTGEECKLKFLRALKNLRSKAAIPTLLSYALKSPKSTSIVAWKALAALPREHITKEIKNAAIRTFYQIEGGQRKDSTVRTLAADIILENDPTVDDLREFLGYLASRDLVYEVRKYMMQRMEQLSAIDAEFATKLNEAMNLEPDIVNNYNLMALRGLSTAFTRDCMKSRGSNGTLVTVQEVNAGLMKRGVVDVILETQTHKSALFSLGLFAGGLNSFVSSDQEEAVTEEEEAATAGMEISLLGVDIRPFIFFSGQRELMGHVWSGTASDRTPAFQALVNLHRHQEYIPLSSGFVTEVNVDGAMSFDLAGKIQLSLWSRNAESLVDLSTGVVVQGSTKVRTNFVQSNAEFVLSLAPKLELSTDVDFSGPVTLCMRLTQPETVIRYHVYKTERISNSRHKLRKTQRSRLFSPAKSYLLNKKNNEMCSKVFS